MRYTALIVALPLLAACGSSKQMHNTKLAGDWQAVQINVDGDSKDWPSPYPAYDAKALIGYATSNDKENLYVTIETGDPKIQMKILKAGLSVWIDTAGNNKAPYMAINFPLSDDNAQMHAEGMKHGDGMEQGLQNRARKALGEVHQLSLEGFKDCGGGFLALQNNNCGITVRMAIDDYNELIWEASIPFKAIYGKTKLDKTDEGKPISVCFAVKGFKKPERSKEINEGGMNVDGNMRNQGMAGGNNNMNGRMQHRGGQGNPEQETIFETTKTWKRFGLAYK